MKSLKLEDYSLIQPYLDMANYEGYNSNFVTMMMWNHEYHIQYEIHDHFLVMLHHFKDQYFWAMPFTSKEYYKEAIEYMISYSQNHHFEFVIDCAIEAFVKDLNELCHDTFIFERTPYNDDYIYDRKMHQTLSGKKMQKRRNHYNAFKKNYPNYIYRDLDLTDDFDIILECLNRWETEKDGLSESMTSEIFGIMFLLSTKHLLDFEVGGIFIDNVMQAFIIASKLNHSTIQIHVEKANKHIRGLYPAILKEMLEHHFPDELYINREEDMGLENLKKSKLSLHPIKMINKYKIYLKDIKIRQAKDRDTPQIVNLWKKCFKDEDRLSTQYYYHYLYNKENTYILKQRNRILSVIQIPPMMIRKNNQEQKSHFILGVCTDPHYQGQGLMKQLLHYVLDLYKDYPIYLQAYVPEIYRPFGFNASHYHQIIELDKEILSLDNSIHFTDDMTLLKIYYDKYTLSFDEYKIRCEHDFEMLIKRCQAFQDHILVIENRGYMIYHETDEEIYINEFIYLHDYDILPMLNYFYKSDKVIKIECDLTVNIPHFKENIITMMSNQIDEDQVNDHLYINELY